MNNDELDLANRVFIGEDSTGTVKVHYSFAQSFIKVEFDKEKIMKLSEKEISDMFCLASMQALATAGQAMMDTYGFIYGAGAFQDIAAEYPEEPSIVDTKPFDKKKMN